MTNHPETNSSETPNSSNHPEGSWQTIFDSLPTFEKTTYGVLGAMVERYVLVDKDFISEILKQHGDKRYEEGVEDAICAFVDNTRPSNDQMVAVRAIRALIPKKEL